jgi:hypothetical protein
MTDDRCTPDETLQELLLQYLKHHYPHEHFAVTLVVPGGAVSGYVESAEDFASSSHQLLVQNVLTATSNTGQPSEFAKRFQNSANAAASKAAGQYLHLSSATLTAPGEPSIQLAHIRVRLGDVSAWAVGYLNPPPLDLLT